MAMPRATTLLLNWGDRLQADALAARILRRLSERKNEVQRCALDGLQRENPAFGQAANEQFQKEAVGHCNDILAVMLATATGEVAKLGPDPLGFVRLHAVRRARQQFPLAGSLNAYRLAHKGYWAVMREAVVTEAHAEEETGDCLMMLSEFLLEFFDLISGAMTDAYIAEEKHLLAQRTRVHVSLVEDLMHGRQPGDLATQGLYERCGIGPGARIAVVIARLLHGGNGVSIDHEMELRCLARNLDRTLSSHRFGKLVDVRNGEVLAIAAGATETARGVMEALRNSATELATDMSVAIGIGVSLDATEISALPQSYQEAERAVEFALAERPVMHFADINLLELLTHRPDATALRLIPDWAFRLKEADAGKEGALSRTIHAFADCNFNVKQTARRLDLHANTVYFRLNRISKLTGVDPRSYSGISLLLTTLRLVDAEARGSISRA
jgi:hypothetical protein